MKIQGYRGEIIDNAVYYLDPDNRPKQGEILIESRLIETADRNPNLHYVEEISKISFEGEVLYTPGFGLCGLSQDEASPYPLTEAMQDAYMAIRMREAEVLT